MYICILTLNDIYIKYFYFSFVKVLRFYKENGLNIFIS